jgi:hypothetical protein
MSMKLAVNMNFMIYSLRNISGRCVVIIVEYGTLMHLLVIPTSSLITSIRSTGPVEKNMTSSPVDRTIVGNLSANNEFKTLPRTFFNC